MEEKREVNASAVDLRLTKSLTALNLIPVSIRNCVPASYAQLARLLATMVWKTE